MGRPQRRQAAAQHGDQAQAGPSSPAQGRRGGDLRSRGPARPWLHLGLGFVLRRRLGREFGIRTHLEAVADPGNGDDGRGAAAGLEQSSQPPDTAVDRVFPDHPPGPATGDQVVARHHLAVGAGQRHQDLHHPRLEPLDRPGPLHLAHRRTHPQAAEVEIGLAGELDRRGVHPGSEMLVHRRIIVRPSSARPFADHRFMASGRSWRADAPPPGPLVRRSPVPRV